MGIFGSDWRDEDDKDWDQPLWGRNMREDLNQPHFYDNSNNVNSNDKAHLQWIFNRLKEVYKENPNFDYMIKLKQIINKI